MDPFEGYNLNQISRLSSQTTSLDDVVFIVFHLFQLFFDLFDQVRRLDEKGHVQTDSIQTIFHLVVFEKWIQRSSVDLSYIPRGPRQAIHGANSWRKSLGGYYTFGNDLFDFSSIVLLHDSQILTFLFLPQSVHSATWNSSYDELDLRTIKLVLHLYGNSEFVVS